MCIICVEFQKNNLTLSEARSNLGEVSETLTDKHLKEVNELLDEAEKETAENKDGQEDLFKNVGGGGNID